MTKQSKLSAIVQQYESDTKEYHSNLIFNTHYLIRDVFNTSELLAIKELVDDVLANRIDGGYDD